jgi:hypothetical protein
MPDNSSIKFGYLLDSAVVNIGYRTDSLEGMTGADGSFQYLEGETLEFFIGDLVFPSVRARATVTPLELAGTGDASHQMVINIARLLQSLDVDGNPANGITIGTQAASAATQIDFDQSVAAFAQDPAVTNLIANSGSTRTTLVSAADALAHLQATLSHSVNDRVVVSADGSGNTYELFNQRLGGTAVESPVCDYSSDTFGRRITDVFDETLNTHVFAFHILRDVDGDRCIDTITDRQRIEIKTYGPSPAKLKGTRGETHTYRWKFKLDEGFQPSNHFTHIFQIKASGGNDDGPPILTLSPRSGNPERMEVIHTASAGFNSGPHVRAWANLADFKGEWIDAYVRAYYEEQGRVEVILRRVSDGEVLLHWSHNNHDMWRAGAGFNRPKWGIYRSLNNVNALRDETVLFNDFCIAEGTNTCPGGVDD